MSSTARRIFFPLIFFFCALTGAEKLPENGVFLSLTAEGPRLEKRLCGPEVRGAGDFYYFHKDKKSLCVHAVTLHPGATLIRIEKSKEPITIAGGWQLAEGIDSQILFDPAAPFEEGHDESGSPLTEGEYGGFTDAAGLLQVPRFIRRNGAWEAVVPLRELFLLQVQKDRSFALEILSAASLNDAAKDPLRAFGITAARTTLRTRTKSGVSFTGAGFSKIRIPAFALVPGDSFGRYRITVKSDLTAAKKGPAKKRDLALGSLSAHLAAEANGSFDLEIVVNSPAIPEAEAEKLSQFLRRELPESFAAGQ